MSDPYIFVDGNEVDGSLDCYELYDNGKELDETAIRIMKKFCEIDIMEFMYITLLAENISNKILQKK